MRGTLSNERTGLSFTIVAGPHQLSHSQVRVMWDSWPYFTVLDSRHPFSSPPATCRTTVRVWDSQPEFFFQLNTCGHNPDVTSSLARGWVCHLQLLLALTSEFILRSESHRTHDHIFTLSDLRLLQPEAQVPIFISPRNRVGPSYTPRHWVPFPSPFMTPRAMVEVIRTHLHTLEGQSAMPWRINSSRTEYKTA
jgi:hypothetical protein